jgi:outer membrane protein OmpA-like peptidoglycan-associated protein
MQKRTIVMTACLLVMAVAVFPGCVSKKQFRTNTEATDTRVDSVESAVEANEKRIDDLSKETDQRIQEVGSAAAAAAEIGEDAMVAASAAADAAEEAAKGKILWEIALSDDQVKFQFNEAGMAPEAAAILDELAKDVLEMDRAVYVEVEGHTDNVGSESYNLVLGKLRATTVRDYLNGVGVPLHAINTISYGEAKPVADNSTREGRAQNRRVVIRVLE